MCVRGVWLPHTEALFDIRVVDTDTLSYLRHALSKVLLNAEMERKNKYAEACAARRTHFTPLCLSVNGLAGSEATCFLKRMACRLSSLWDRSYVEVLGVDLCPIGFCNCASFIVVCAWFSHQIVKFGPGRWCCH